MDSAITLLREMILAFSDFESFFILTIASN